MAIRVQYLNKAVCISCRTITFQKDVNQTFTLPPVKQLAKLGSLTFVWQPIYEKENRIQIY